MMSKLKLLALGLLLVPSTVQPAGAQVTIDVAKITCEQFLLDKIAEARLLSAWLDGYYNGKRNNTVVEPQILQSNADKVGDYCRANKTMPLMKAVEAALGLGK